MSKEPVVTCPHCQMPVVIEQVNCAIFRHGISKTDGKQIDPHASQMECERLIREDAIYGCGKPFRIILGSNGEWFAEICDYI